MALNCGLSSGFDPGFGYGQKPKSKFDFLNMHIYFSKVYIYQKIMWHIIKMDRYFQNTGFVPSNQISEEELFRQLYHFPIVKDFACYCAFNVVKKP